MSFSNLLPEDPKLVAKIEELCDRLQSVLPNVNLHEEISKYLAMEMGLEEIERTLLRRVKDYRYQQKKKQISEESEEESASSEEEVNPA